MNIFDFDSPLLQVLSVPAAVVLAVLVVLTMRSVALGDRAMLFGKAGPSDDAAKRLVYENRWRNGGVPTA